MILGEHYKVNEYFLQIFNFFGKNYELWRFLDEIDVRRESTRSIEADKAHGLDALSGEGGGHDGGEVVESAVEDGGEFRHRAMGFQGFGD